MNRLSRQDTLNFYPHAVNQMKAASQNKLDLAKARTILSGRTSQGLTSAEIAVLLTAIKITPDDSIRALIIDASSSLRAKLFSNKYKTMVPLEVTSYCASNCTFCGWRSNNREINRFKIDLKGTTEQARNLIDLGFEHIEISSGDDLFFIKNELAGHIKAIKNAAAETKKSVDVSICLTPLHESNYRELKSSAGLDCVLTWQETYSKDKFYEMVTGGPKMMGVDENLKLLIEKNGYERRIDSAEDAIRAGLQIGMGVMIGLDNVNPEADLLALLFHAKTLQSKYSESIQPIIFGMPVWNSITTASTDNRANFESGIDATKNFTLVAAIYLLAMPDHSAWIFPNCRVPLEIQTEALLAAGYFTSTMVRLGPGAYLDPKGADLGSYFEKFVIKEGDLNQTAILKGEQFVHFYEDHAKYIIEFKKSGLEQVAVETFNELVFT